MSGILSGLIVSSYIGLKAEKQFTTNLYKEIEYNVKVLEEFNFSKENIAPLHSYQLETSMKDYGWQEHKDSFKKTDDIEKFYNLLYGLKSDIERMWESASSGNNELSLNLLNSYRETSQKAILTGRMIIK